MWHGVVEPDSWNWPEEPMDSYQTVTLVLADGRRVHYTGKPQIDHINPPRVVEVIVSTSKPLPKGMTWDVMPEPCEGKDVCR